MILDFEMSIFYHIYNIWGCVMHIYSLRSINSLKAMEMHGNFHPHSPQGWVVREYNSHGLEYFLGPNKVNK